MRTLWLASRCAFYALLTGALMFSALYAALSWARVILEGR